MPTALITGGTGFIGRTLSQQLAADGYRIIILSRSQHSSTEAIRYIRQLDDIHADLSVDVIINLAGESLDSARWNTLQKNRIVQSRIGVTRNIQQWLRKQNRSVPLLISGSAIGWYGHQQDKPLYEDAIAADGFSHRLCDEWEKTARQCHPNAQRIVLIRTGIVLEKDGGPLKAMLLPFKMGLGGKMGSGRQIWSWIHREDWIRLVKFIIDHDNISGPVNATAPEPVTQASFANTLASTLKRPAILPMPAPMARLAMGEFADEVLLNGQAVYPKKAQDAGFPFRYPTLPEALQAILG